MMGLSAGQKKFDDRFSRLGTIPACDRQTPCHSIVHTMHTHHLKKWLLWINIIHIIQLGTLITVDLIMQHYNSNLTLEVVRWRWSQTIVRVEAVDCTNESLFNDDTLAAPLSVCPCEPWHKWSAGHACTHTLITIWAQAAGVNNAVT